MRGGETFRKDSKYFRDDIKSFNKALIVAKRASIKYGGFCSVAELGDLEFMGQTLGLSVWCFGIDKLGHDIYFATYAEGAFVSVGMMMNQWDDNVVLKLPK